MGNLQFVLLLLFSSYLLNAQKINLGRSGVDFSISNMGFNTVEGTIKGMEGDVYFDSLYLEKSYFKVCVDPNTLNTDNEKRDEHLKKEDFFFIESFPNICFSSETVIRGRSGFIALGELEMHGIKKEIKIPFTFSDNVYEGMIEVDRSFYSVGPSGGFMAGKIAEVKIKCVVD